MEEKINLSSFRNPVSHNKKDYEYCYPEEKVREAIKELKEEVKINFSNVDINCYVEKDCAEHFNKIIDKIFGRDLI